MHTPQAQAQAQAQGRKWLEIWYIKSMTVTGWEGTRRMPSFLYIKGRTYEIKEQLKRIVYEVSGKRLMWSDVWKYWEVRDITDEQAREIIKRIVLELDLTEEDVDLDHAFNYYEEKAFWEEIRKVREGGK